MNNISIRSTLVLSILGALALALLIIVEHSKKFQKKEHYQEKMAAAKLSNKCMQHIKNNFFANEIAIDNINDPNATGIIGQQFSEITSGRGSLPVKLSTTNPNFAAMIVQQIKDAGLQKGDHVALCFTGSFPALDIATCAAIETLELKPILITSVTSSSWGANNPDLTWLDMQKSLKDAQLISFMPSASSTGGNQDIGRTLSREGRDLVQNIIRRNHIPYLNQGNLEGNINKRMDIFNKTSKGKVKLFINVGGGIASLGSNTNARNLPSGLNKDLKIKDFQDKQGVMFEMVKKGVPVINLLNINRLMNKYDLPRDPVPLPKVGEGKLFKAYKYDLNLVIGVSLVFLALILVVMYYDEKQNKLGSQIIKKID
ncbi:MAG: poly-gamma-glutamate system protein [Flavobacteriaceae bacterium]|nr:poly-gamma-glutamate system protein [Flavobacteriaceae bacterium]